MLKLSFSIVILSILLTPSVARQRIAASETPPAADTVARTEPTASDGTAALPRPAADTVSAMTLDACMAYAVEHNPNVRQQIYANRNYRQEHIASIAALVPSISASASATTSFGRSVDPETNTYTTVANLDNSYSLSGQIPVFAGLSGINSVRLAREQRQTSAANLHKSRKLYELGLKSAADVAEIESQCASDDFLLTQQENNLALAKISLCEAMNYPSGCCPEIVAEIAVGTPAGAAAYGEVLAYALEKHPKAQQAAYNVQQMRLKYSVAKGKYYPSVSVGGGYSTNFFMSLDDRSLYAPFGSQLRDNRGYYFSARLSIPIFGGLTKRTSVNRARNNWRIAELQRDATLRTLQSEVAQAYQQMLGAGKEFVQASKKAEAARLAYEAVAGKYERGMVSALDLQTASDKLLQARAERIRTRLQYIIKTRLVEYYNGEPLIR